MKSCYTVYYYKFKNSQKHDWWERLDNSVGLCKATQTNRLALDELLWCDYTILPSKHFWQPRNTSDYYGFMVFIPPKYVLLAGCKHLFFVRGTGHLRLHQNCIFCSVIDPVSALCFTSGTAKKKKKNGICSVYQFISIFFHDFQSQINPLYMSIFYCYL